MKKIGWCTGTTILAVACVSAALFWWQRPTFATLADAASQLEYRPFRPRLSFVEYRRFGNAVSLPLSVQGAVAPIMSDVKDEYLRGVAYLLAGDSQRAVGILGTIARRRDDPRLWNDYAAALLVRAERDNDPRLAIDALSAAQRAVQGGYDAAQFNRALALETIGLLGEAREAWRHVPRDGANVPWAEEARQAESRLTAVMTRRPDDLGLRRRQAEGITLGEWADATLRNDLEAAAALLEDVRVVADHIERSVGERLLRDAVRAIDVATPSNRLRIARAQVAYRAGRLAHRAHEPVAAEAKFRQAADGFAGASSPMAYLARYFTGSALHAQSRFDETRALLDDLATEHLEEHGYLALAAQIGWERGLARFSQGSLAEPLSIFERARELAMRAGDRDLAAQLDLLAVQVLDAIGDARAAWRRRKRVFSDLATSGNEQRTVVALNAAASVLLRVDQRERARAILDVSTAAAARAGDAVSAVQAHTERSTVEVNPWPDLEAALRWLMKVGDEKTRDRLHISLDLARGVALRSKDPAAAIVEISRAVETVERTGAEILVPRLLLERGRIYQTLGDHRQALLDFERGIKAVERQRSTLSLPEQRATVLATAEKLFDSAIEAALAAREPELAFEFAERARARTLFEQIHRSRDAKVMTVAEICASLASDAAIVEYWTLPDRLVAFVLRRSGFKVVTTPVARTRLAETADLYPLLITPLGLADVARVAFVSGGALANVPFAGLLDRDTSQFAIDRWSVSQAPSASVAVTCSRRASAAWRGPTLVVGATEVDRRAYPGLEALPWVPREAAAVAAQTNARLLMGREATRSALLKELPRAAAMHYAGHALADKGDPTSGRLILAPEPGGNTIEAREIAQMRLPDTRLVVLAACGSAQRTRATDGVDSLASAFLAAGVAMVVATTADIDDRFAASFSRNFHASLAHTGDPAAALRNALRAEAREKNGTPRNPTQWARVVLTGGAPGLVE